jgi:hypothetical protein
VTSTVFVPEGDVATIEVADRMLNAVAAFAPNETAVAPRNPVPVIVTDVPPPVEPTVGEIAVTAGRGK